MKTILIAYDGSTCADALLGDLTRAGLPEEVQATVLSVAEVWLPAGAEDPLSEAFARLPAVLRKTREEAWTVVETQSRRLAERAAERLSGLFPKWRLQPMAVGDSPAWAIVKTAAAQQADLVIVGSRGRATMERVFLGSVSHKVASQAPCSVRIARPSPQRGPLRVVLALDGSRDSEMTVRAVLARTWPPGTLFKIVTVIDAQLKAKAAYPTLWSQDWTQQHDAEAGESVCRAVEYFAARLQNAGLATETHILEGDPKHLLLKHAVLWAADCIFVGAHSLAYQERRTLGTLASALATRAHCAVEIVREKVTPTAGLVKPLPVRVAHAEPGVAA
jgi:nucleotide-binding universal stress UspA family protein